MYDHIKPGVVLAKRVKTGVRLLLISLVFFSLSAQPMAAQAETLDAKNLIRAAMNHWRGLTSFSDMTLTVHRRDWQREMSMLAWTKGEKTSLVRVVEPRRDAGNGSLIKDQNMWSYSPKINRIIKIPSSMMNQSWMGSDFSNKDISKSTDIIEQYDHRLIKTESIEGLLYYSIESIPHEDAAIVWGREVLVVREDFVMIRHEFWDQDDILVKTMNALEVAPMGGRNLATRLRMSRADKPDEWTEIIINRIDFDVALADSLFTQSSLRNPRP